MIYLSLVSIFIVFLECQEYQLKIEYSEGEEITYEIKGSGNFETTVQMSMKLPESVKAEGETEIPPITIPSLSKTNVRYVDKIKKVSEEKKPLRLERTFEEIKIEIKAETKKSIDISPPTEELVEILEGKTITLEKDEDTKEVNISGLKEKEKEKAISLAGSDLLDIDTDIEDFLPKSNVKISESWRKDYDEKELIKNIPFEMKELLKYVKSREMLGEVKSTLKDVKENIAEIETKGEIEIEYAIDGKDLKKLGVGISAGGDISESEAVDIEGELSVKLEIKISGSYFINLEKNKFLNSTFSHTTSLITEGELEFSTSAAGTKMSIPMKIKIEMKGDSEETTKCY